jgi:hypothetical protein
MALRTARRLVVRGRPPGRRRRQNWRNPGPRRVGQVGVVESRVHRPLPLARVSALTRQTSTFQTPSKTASRVKFFGRPIAGNVA